jgi:hypothetical protein
MPGRHDLDQLDTGDAGHDGVGQLSHANGRRGEGGLLLAVQPHGVAESLAYFHAPDHRRGYEKKRRQKGDQNGDSPADRSRA